MRVFAVSDIHIDHASNADWVAAISASDHRDDVLILAGDVTDSPKLLEWCLTLLAKRFKKVLFLPGNHELWVIREEKEKTSLQKFEEIVAIVEASGASMQPYFDSGITIVPLLGWYDYSFGEPNDELKSMWMDYRACRWPHGFDAKKITAHFVERNNKHMLSTQGKVITFSHFLPRIDIMPNFIPADMRQLYPILGTRLLDVQLRRLNSNMHVYGHSHVNRKIAIDGVTYINNAFGYPKETHITSKSLLCIHET